MPLTDRSAGDHSTRGISSKSVHEEEAEGGNKEIILAHIARASYLAGALPSPHTPPPSSLSHPPFRNRNNLEVGFIIPLILTAPFPSRARLRISQRVNDLNRMISADLVILGECVTRTWGTVAKGNERCRGEAESREGEGARDADEQ
eukprot:757002-Hanusia_phi.AAC.5